MDKFLSYTGGLIGGYALLSVPVGNLLSSLEPVLDVVGALTMVVFSAALIVRGISSLVSRV